MKREFRSGDVVMIDLSDGIVYDGETKEQATNDIKPPEHGYIDTIDFLSFVCGCYITGCGDDPGFRVHESHLVLLEAAE